MVHLRDRHGYSTVRRTQQLWRVRVEQRATTLRLCRCWLRQALAKWDVFLHGAEPYHKDRAFASGLDTSRTCLHWLKARCPTAWLRARGPSPLRTCNPQLSRRLRCSLSCWSSNSRSSMSTQIRTYSMTICADNFTFSYFGQNKFFAYAISN